MAEIINIAKNDVPKTQIMSEANLSFSQLTRYLKILTYTKLLEKTVDYGKEIYKVTQKGKDFLITHKQMMELLS